LIHLPLIPAREHPGRVGFFLVVSLLLGLSIVHIPAVAALLFPTVAGLLALPVLTRYLCASDGGELDTHRILTWTIGSFLAHLLFSLAVTGIGGTVSDVLRGPDSITYNAHAITMVRHWADGFPFPNLPAGKEGFYYLLAALYWLLGAHVVAGLAVNAALIAAAVPLVADTTRRLFGSQAAKYACPLVVVLPGMFLWTAQLGKEAAALMLIAVAANCGVRLVERSSPGALLGLTTSIALLFTLRGWVALTLAGGFLAGITLSRPKLVGGLSTGATAVGALGLLVVTTGVGYSGYREATKSDLKEANAVRQELALTGRTGFDQEVDISTGGEALAYLPIGLARLTLGPFPWQLRGVRQLPGVLEVVVWWALLPSLWVGIRGGWQVAGRRLIVLVAPALITAILFSLSIGNYGTQLRERLQVVMLLVPFIALGLAVRKERSSTASVSV